MYDLWETVLFKDMTYSGNPMKTHIHLNKQFALLDKEFFEAWLSLWKAIVEEHFEGEKAGKAIDRAEKMTALITYKIAESKCDMFIQ